MPLDPFHALLDLRDSILRAGHQWSEFNDLEATEAFASLMSVQESILESDFSERAVAMAALKLLFEGAEQPNFSDDFKNRLFEALRAVFGSGSGAGRPSTNR